MQQLENWFVSYGQSVWGQILLFNITAHSFIAGRGRILNREMCCIPCSDAYCSHPQDCRDSQYPQELLSLQISTIHSFPCVWEFYTPEKVLTWSVAIKFLKLETWHTCCRQMLTNTCPGATYIYKTSQCRKSHWWSHASQSVSIYDCADKYISVDMKYTTSHNKIIDNIMTW